MNARVYSIDPERDTHYAIGEEGEWWLRDIAEAMECFGGMLDQLRDDAEVPPVGLAATCRVWSRAVEAAIANRVAVFPKAGR